MATRQESAERTRALITELRARVRRGDFPVGARIPSLAELGARHGLSKPTVSVALQPLIVDGTLEVRSRVGMYVADACRPYGVHVAVTNREHAQDPVVRRGFAAQLDKLGAECLALEAAQFVDLVATGGLPPILGVFVFAPEWADEVVAAMDPDVPVVQYSSAVSPAPDQTRVSYVDIDNVDVGRRAARELLFTGHRNIAFLSMQADDHPMFDWSSQRGHGWAETMRRHQPRSPVVSVESRDEATPAGSGGKVISTTVRTRVASLAADRRDAFSACVCADDRMVMALSRELRARGVPEVEWPVMVGVEGLATGVATHIASVIPDWSTLGARAGQLLFDSAVGRPGRLGQIDLVPAARVTSRHQR